MADAVFLLGRQLRYMSRIPGDAKDGIKTETSAAAFIKADRSLTHTFKHVLFTVRRNEHNDRAKPRGALLFWYAGQRVEQSGAAVAIGGGFVIARRTNT